MIFLKKIQHVLTALMFGAISISITIITPAQAQEISSVYTQLDLDNCKLLTRDELGLPAFEEEEMGIRAAAGYAWVMIIPLSMLQREICALLYPLDKMPCRSRPPAKPLPPLTIWEKT